MVIYLLSLNLSFEFDTFPVPSGARPAGYTLSYLITRGPVAPQPYKTQFIVDKVAVSHSRGVARGGGEGDLAPPPLHPNLHRQA